MEQTLFFLKKFRTEILQILIVAALGMLAYSNTMHVPFQHDEGFYIAENPFVTQNFTVEELKTDKELYKTLKNRHAAYLTFVFNYRIHGLDVTGYHIINLGIHLSNAMLVYALALLLLRTPALASASTGAKAGLIPFFSALLFVAHPIQTEAVTYIYQRITELAAFFYLLSVVAYLKARLTETEENNKDKRQRVMVCLYFVLSTAAAVLAMKTKENAFTLPVTVAMCEILFFAGKVRSRLIRLAPVFLTSSIIPYTYLVGLSGSFEYATKSFEHLSRSVYLITQLRVFVTYIRLLVFPVNQSHEYEYPIYDTVFDPAVILSLFFVLLVSGAGVHLLRLSYKKDPVVRLPASGIFWLFITLSVESGLIPLPAVINENRLYLPSVGIFIAASSLLFIAAQKRGETAEKKLVALLTVVCAVFAGATYARNIIWQDTVTLWQDTAKKSPGVARVHYNLGNAYKNKGDFARARREWEDTLRLDPAYSRAANQLGNWHYMARDLDKAKQYYAFAVQSEPANAEARFNLALALEILGETEEAAKQYEAFLSNTPREYQSLAEQVRLKLPALKGR